MSQKDKMGKCACVVELLSGICIKIDCPFNEGENFESGEERNEPSFSSSSRSEDNININFNSRFNSISYSNYNFKFSSEDNLNTNSN